MGDEQKGEGFTRRHYQSFREFSHNEAWSTSETDRRILTSWRTRLNRARPPLPPPVPSPLSSPSPPGAAGVVCFISFHFHTRALLSTFRCGRRERVVSFPAGADRCRDGAFPSGNGILSGVHTPRCVGFVSACVCARVRGSSNGFIFRPPLLLPPPSSPQRGWSRYVVGTETQLGTTCATKGKS